MSSYMAIILLLLVVNLGYSATQVTDCIQTDRCRAINGICKLNRGPQDCPGGIFHPGLCDDPTPKCECCESNAEPDPPQPPVCFQTDQCHSRNGVCKLNRGPQDCPNGFFDPDLCIGPMPDCQCCRTDCPCSPWRYTRCSKTCGTGVRFGLRRCTPRNCQPETKREPCTNTCILWGRWTPWSRCTPTCDGGTQTRRRVCIHPRCRELVQTQTRSCRTPPCPVVGPPSLDCIQTDKCHSRNGVCKLNRGPQDCRDGIFELGLCNGPPPDCQCCRRLTEVVPGTCPAPCQNNGICSAAEDGTFACDCPIQYTGPTCEAETCPYPCCPEGCEVKDGICCCIIEIVEVYELTIIIRITVIKITTYYFDPRDKRYVDKLCPEIHIPIKTIIVNKMQWKVDTRKNTLVIKICLDHRICDRDEKTRCIQYYRVVRIWVYVDNTRDMDRVLDAYPGITLVTERVNGQTIHGFPVVLKIPSGCDCP